MSRQNRLSAGHRITGSSQGPQPEIEYYQPTGWDRLKSSVRRHPIATGSAVVALSIVGLRGINATQSSCAEVARVTIRQGDTINTLWGSRYDDIAGLNPEDSLYQSSRNSYHEDARRTESQLRQNRIAHLWACGDATVVDQLLIADTPATETIVESSEPTTTELPGGLDYSVTAYDNCYQTAIATGASPFAANLVSRACEGLPDYANQAAQDAAN